MSIDVDALKNLPLFAGLSTVELEEIASVLKLRTFDAKERIIAEGDSPGHPIFILMSGSVEVVKNGVNGRQHVISTLSAPSVFGEVEVLAKRPAIASVHAVSKVQLAELGRGIFDELANQNRTSVLKVIRNLAQTLSFRLAATDETLATYFDGGDPALKAKLGLMRNVMYTGWNAP